VDLSFSQIVHSLVGLIKYGVALVILVAIAKMAPFWWGNTCYIEPEDVGMRDALGKTTLKVNYNPAEWNHADIRRGDIVVVKMEFAAGSDEDAQLKKFPFRVVAVEGDLIQASRGKFKVNLKEEKYAGINLVPDEQTGMALQRVPRGYVYVLPDDRLDAKGGHPGLVPTWRIVGKLRKKS
jgi:hypothetical protein